MNKEDWLEISSKVMDREEFIKKWDFIWKTSKFDTVMTLKNICAIFYNFGYEDYTTELNEKLMSSLNNYVENNPENDNEVIFISKKITDDMLLAQLRRHKK